MTRKCVSHSTCVHGIHARGSKEVCWVHLCSITSHAIQETPGLAKDKLQKQNCTKKAENEEHKEKLMRSMCAPLRSTRDTEYPRHYTARPKNNMVTIVHLCSVTSHALQETPRLTNTQVDK